MYVFLYETVNGFFFSTIQPCQETHTSTMTRHLRCVQRKGRTCTGSLYTSLGTVWVWTIRIPAAR